MEIKRGGKNLFVLAPWFFCFDVAFFPASIVLRSYSLACCCCCYCTTYFQHLVDSPVFCEDEQDVPKSKRKRFISINYHVYIALLNFPYDLRTGEGAAYRFPLEYMYGRPELLTSLAGV